MLARANNEVNSIGPVELLYDTVKVIYFIGPYRREQVRQASEF